jgi:cystathionine beta-lyase/cystathionine gamma-synthase
LILYVRLSVGVEDAGDVIRDVLASLDSLSDFP